MCKLCMSYPCDNRCPNAPEPKAVEHCAYCKDGIFEGEEMVEIDGRFYHVDCIAEMSTTELLNILGLETEVA